MKVKVLNYRKIDNANVNITFDILQDDGTIFLHVEDRGFTSTAKTKGHAKAELIKSFKNIKDSHQNVLESKLDELLLEIVGTEINISDNSFNEEG